jgi:uncharacterized protein (TIGR03437 family)
MVLLLPFAAGWQAAAQTWDNSGNGLLKGAYYFREVAWLVGDNSGDLQEAVSVYGSITFDGNGNWTITTANGAQVMDSNNNAPQTNFTANGTYSIAPSGYGSMSSLISQGASVFGLVSQGIFVASSTENGNYNDLFIAAQLPSTTPVNSTFQGAFSMMSADFPAPSPISNNSVLYTRASSFQLNPDGNGGIGTVRLTGYIAGNGKTQTTQNVSGVRYRFSNGAAVVSFGGTLSASSNLIAGDKYLYFSPDTNFVFGGSPTGWDMIVGVRTSSNSGTPKFNGLYYEAGVAQDDSQLSSGSANLSTGYGAVNSISGYLLAHQRVLSAFSGSINVSDYTYADSASANSDGTFDDSYNHYVFGAGGAIGIALAKAPSLGIEALVQAPTLSGSGVYIDPTRIQNAGSNAPFTAQWAPGELISIYGTNLASSTTTDYSLPTTVGDVQVMINNQPAPLVFVSQNQINAVVPISITSLTASIQVINKIGSSNTVYNYVGLTQPGVFPEFIGGINYAAAQHSDFSQVTPSSPAVVGETLQVYLTGLGGLNASGNTTSTFTAYIDGVPATVSFAGSASSIGGGYQLNVVVPSGIHSGSVYLDIVGPDSYNSEAALPIAPGNGASAIISGLPRLRRPALQSTAPESVRRR